MKYCKRCLYPENHPLHITFDEEGVCSGCRIHEEKDNLDWSKRANLLKELFDKYRSPSGMNYDCIIPVSGARDSYFIVHTVKNIYKMNPLLVSYNKHYNTKRGIRNLAYLRTIFNCDFVMKTVDPKIVQKITRTTLKKTGSMYWHCLAGQTAFTVQMATRFKIPLIVWGVHQGCDQVGMFSHLDEVEMTRKYRKDHDLMDIEAEDLISNNNDISERDLDAFIYPHDKQIEAVGVRGIYLSNYIRWDSKKQHEMMIEKYGYETFEQQRTFDTYNDVDCFHYSGIHDYIKFLKYGYGKVTDHACREIRLKRLSREEGIALVKKYQNIAPQDLPLLLNWLDVSENAFYDYVDRHHDPRIWNFSKQQGWELKDSILNHITDENIDPQRLEKIEGCQFEITPSRVPTTEEKGYTLMAKGYAEYE